ncbi:MAG: SBBP repeat-containing protein, partial [Candidatus Zixiibacteriota bacterium]
MLKRVLLLILLILWAAPLFAQSVDTAWVRRYNGPGNDWDAARAIVVNNSESIYVTGMSKGSGTDRDYATIKYNFNGDELWVRRYNGPGNYSDQAFAIVADNFGNVYVTGGSESDYVTIKYDSSGNEIWVRRYTPGEVGMAIEVDGSENVYVTGLNHTIKYDAQGNELWTGEWG